jgi:phage-related protein
MSYALSFGGLTLEEMAQIANNCPMRIDDEEYPRQHGSMVPEVAFLGARRLVFGGRVVKSTEAALDAYFDSLAQKTAEAGKDKLVIKNNSRYYNAICTGLAQLHKAGEAPSLAREYTLEFLAGDPFSYSTTESVSGPTTIVASPTTIVIANNGGYRTPPKIEITAVGADKTDVTITNGANGLFFHYPGTIKSGNVLTADMAKKLLQNGGDARAANDLAAGSTLDWNLEVGNNNIRYDGPASGVTVKITWRERWAS